MNKRTHLSLDQKAKLIEESTKPGFNRTAAAKAYGISISGLSKTLKNKDAILDTIIQGRSGSMKNISKSKYEFVEEKLYDWYCQTRFIVPITGPMLQAKAQELFLECISDLPAFCSPHENPKFSTGWLGRFKNRYNITLKRCKSEPRDK